MSEPKQISKVKRQVLSKAAAAAAGGGKPHSTPLRTNQINSNQLKSNEIK